MADNTQEDLSMEDILSSIKNILVEDEAVQPAPAAEKTFPAASEPLEEEPLNLGAPVEDEPLDLGAPVEDGEPLNLDAPLEEEEIFDLSAKMQVEDEPLELQADEESDPFDLSRELEAAPLSANNGEKVEFLADENADPFYEESEISPSEMPEIDLSRLENEFSKDVYEQETVVETEPLTAETAVPDDTAENFLPAGENEPAPLEPFALEVPAASEPESIEAPASDKDEDFKPVPAPKAEETARDVPDASDNMLNNFAQMFTPAAPRAATLGDGGKTLETLVKEVIAEEVSSYVEQNLETLATRDLIMAETSRQISAWVDANLQKLVEEIVRQEIVRVMAKVGNN